MTFSKYCIMYSDFVIVIETLFESLFTNFLISRFMLNVNKLVITLCHINYFCVKINILLLFSTEVVLNSFSSILYTSLHLLKSERCSLTDCRVKKMFFSQFVVRNKSSSAIVSSKKFKSS